MVVGFFGVFLAESDGFLESAWTPPEDHGIYRIVESCRFHAVVQIFIHRGYPIQGGAILGCSHCLGGGGFQIVGAPKEERPRIPFGLPQSDWSPSRQHLPWPKQKHIRNGPDETTDLADQPPEIVRTMRSQYDAWFTDVASRWSKPPKTTD